MAEKSKNPKSPNLNYFSSVDWLALMEESAEKRKEWAPRRARVSAKRMAEEGRAPAPKQPKKHPARSKAQITAHAARKANRLRECEEAYRAKRKRRQAALEANAMWKLCIMAMAPGAWHTIRQIAEALGDTESLSARDRSARHGEVRFAMARYAEAKGMVERGQAEGLDWWGKARPVLAYRLTERGEEAKEALS